MDKIENLTYWITAIVALGFIGYSCFCYIKKRQTREREQALNRNSRLPEVEPAASQQIREEDTPSLTPIISYFKGQCNSFKIVAEKPRNIENCEKVFEYADKVINFHADKTLKKWWNNFTNDRNQWDLALYSKKAKQVLDLLREAGVIRATEQIIKWDDNASKHYMPFDDIKNGDTGIVIHPCWIYQNDIFEQGLVSKKVD